MLGVLNATPDSFHAPSRAPRLEEALAAGRRLAAEGADLLDVGGESTRPGSEPVPAAVEIDRVCPAIERLAAELALPLSVDTCKAAVARAAVAAGAALVNDVSGGLFDPAMAATVAELGVPVILGHLRGTPRTMHEAQTYDDVVAEVRDELGARVAAFVAAGVAAESILVDPGIGFSKRAADNLELLRRLGELEALGRPIVVGASRKRFLGEALRARGIASDPGRGATDERLEASLAAAVLAAAGGAVLVRVHDVAATRRALAAADAILHGG